MTPAPPVQRTPAWLRRTLPASRWLPGYDRRLLSADARAGATVAVLLIPQGMAYAALAGMPPVTGLYAAMVSLVVYALLGTSNHVSVAPVAIDSLLVAGAVAPLARGDSARYVALAGVTALLVGAFQVGAGLLKLGGLVSFLSVPVISGFTSAAALTIAASQLKDVLGVSAQGGSTSFLDTVRDLAPKLGEAQPLTIGLGLAAMAVLLLARRVDPRIPGPLLVVVGSTALISLLGWADRTAVVGHVPSALPSPALPAVSWTDVEALVPSAAAIALISYMETISTGTAFARRSGGRVLPDQELVAVGSANAAAGLFGGFPVAGGFSRGAVNFGAGSRTPMAGVLAATGLVAAVLTVTPFLTDLPKVALAAVILVAVASLVDIRGALAVGRIRRSDLVSLAVTALATLVLGPAWGLGVGVATSVAIFLRQTTRVHLPQLGRVPGTGMFRNVERQDVETWPDLVILRVDAPLYFANSRNVADAIADVTCSRKGVRGVIIDCTGITAIDYTGAETLADLDSELAQLGVELHLAAVRGPVRDVLERTRLWGRLQDAGRLHAAVPEAVGVLLATARGWVNGSPLASHQGIVKRTDNHCGAMISPYGLTSPPAETAAEES